MKRYNPKDIESKWQKVWQENEIYKTDTKKSNKKFYIIPMFPYPSGDLHVGHWYNFAPTDTVARWRRMQGHNVLHCNGFDAFGLPAENAAIKRNIPPAEWTRSNIASMTKQIEAIGAGYDWDRKIITSEPEYYKWTQWLFLKLFEKGQAYRKKALVNWCPKDQTVLANEQTIGEDGTKNVCVRCGTPIVQKELEQWYFKITDYADRLLEDAEDLDIPERVKTMQENWIGKSVGAEVDFKLENSDEKLRIFTTRPDTLFGATYMVLAPEHPLVDKITAKEQKTDVDKYVKQTLGKTELDRKEGEKEKTGVDTGAKAINPVNGEKIPIWIADYVLMSYGTGAIMAVPAHDERDFEFAKKFDLPIKNVVEPLFIQSSGDSKVKENMPFAEREAITAIVKHHSEDKYIGLKWKKVDWDTFITGGVEKDQTPEEAARAEILEETGYKNLRLIKQLSNTHSQFFHVPKGENRFAHFSGFLFELEDDQSTKIDKSESEKHDVLWLTRDDMEKFRLPDSHRLLWEEVKNGTKPYAGEGLIVNSDAYSNTDSSQAREKIVADLAKKKFGKEQVNYKLRDWLISRQRYWGAPIPIVYCDDCGTQAVPEKDLPVKLPEDVEFMPTGQSPLLTREDFVNTNCPKCTSPAKRETDTMDTFVDSSWYFLRYPDIDYDKGAFNPEIVNKWGPLDHYIGGIEHAILHLLYARYITKFLHDHHGLKFDEPFKKLSNQGIILGPDGDKMSKSKGNVVSPDEQLGSYGADSLRLYLMFMGPYDQGGPYSFGGIAGVRRFLDRFWNLTQEFNESDTKQHKDWSEKEIRKVTHGAIKDVNNDLHEMQFNTAIAAMMEATNELYKIKANSGFKAGDSWLFAFKTLIQLLAPFAPHIAEELWQELGQEGSVHTSQWPVHDEKYLVEDEIAIVVQINGKRRAEILMPTDSSEESIVKAARSAAKVAPYLDKKEVRKTVYVPQKLVNFVV